MDIAFDLQIQSLKDDLLEARHSYSPSEVREIVLTILLGKNYRLLTEKATRLEISVFMAWLLNTCHRAEIAFGDNWLAKLQESCTATKGELVAKWLRVWLMGLPLKTTTNLGLKVKSYKDYLKHVETETKEIIGKQKQKTSVQLHTAGLKPSTLSAGESAWLLQIAGAAVLTVRGSRKSTIGKLLEKAIARACLSALGLQEEKDFKLNLAADIEVDREIDAEINTKRGKARVDVALIGVGNQEVSEDKLSRVGRNGIVLVDKLGAKSKVPANAAKAGVSLILIQNHLPLSELYNHLEPLMDKSVKLEKPPTNEKALRSLLAGLPDSTFTVVKP